MSGNMTKAKSSTFEVITLSQSKEKKLWNRNHSRDDDLPPQPAAPLSWRIWYLVTARNKVFKNEGTTFILSGSKQYGQERTLHPRSMTQHWWFSTRDQDISKWGDIKTQPSEKSLVWNVLDINLLSCESCQSDTAFNLSSSSVSGTSCGQSSFSTSTPPLPTSSFFNISADTRICALQ